MAYLYEELKYNWETKTPVNFSNEFFDWITRKNRIEPLFTIEDAALECVDLSIEYGEGYAVLDQLGRIEHYTDISNLRFGSVVICEISDGFDGSNECVVGIIERIQLCGKFCDPKIVWLDSVVVH
jgi:hypothetical protein